LENLLAVLPVACIFLPFFSLPTFLDLLFSSVDLLSKKKTLKFKKNFKCFQCKALVTNIAAVHKYNIFYKKVQIENNQKKSSDKIFNYFD
jgi:hypothetical protein